MKPVQENSGRGRDLCFQKLLLINNLITAQASSAASTSLLGETREEENFENDYTSATTIYSLMVSLNQAGRVWHGLIRCSHESPLCDLMTCEQTQLTTPDSVSSLKLSRSRSGCCFPCEPINVIKTVQLDLN